MDEFNLDDLPVDYREYLVDEFLISLPNLDPTTLNGGPHTDFDYSTFPMTYAPPPTSFPVYPPPLQHPRLQIIPYESIEHNSAPDSMPGWSENGTEASHSRNISTVNTPVSPSPERKKRKQREASSGCDSTTELSQPKKCARRSPTEEARQKTNQVRGDKACLPCQLEKRGVRPLTTPSLTFII